MTKSVPSLFMLGYSYLFDVPAVKWTQVDDYACEKIVRRVDHF